MVPFLRLWSLFDQDFGSSPRSICGSTAVADRHMVDDGGSREVGTGRSTPVLPKIKCEHPLRGDADAWIKVAKNVLGPLLAVAEGQTPASAQLIIDIDLNEMPALPARRSSKTRQSKVG